MSFLHLADCSSGTVTAPAVSIFRRLGTAIADQANPSTGEAGVRVTREQRPDLILMDLVLPRLNGWSAREWIKREPGTAQIPLVALTVRASRADRERADALGFASYFAKPRSPTHVLAEVERLIGPAKPGTGRRKTPPGDEAIRWQ